MVGNDAKRPFQPVLNVPAKKKPPPFKPTYQQPPEALPLQDLLPQTMDFSEMLNMLKADSSSKGQSSVQSTSPKDDGDAGVLQDDVEPEVRSRDTKKIQPEALKRKKQVQTGTVANPNQSNDYKDINKNASSQIIPEQKVESRVKHQDDGWSSDEEEEEEEAERKQVPQDAEKDPIVQLMKNNIQSGKQQIVEAERNLQKQKNTSENLSEFDENFVDELGKNQVSSQNLKVNVSGKNSDDVNINKDQILGKKEDDKNKQNNQTDDIFSNDPWSSGQTNFENVSSHPVRAFVPTQDVQVEEKSHQMLEQFYFKQNNSQENNPANENIMQNIQKISKKNNISDDYFGTSSNVPQKFQQNLDIIQEANDESSDGSGWGSDDDNNKFILENIVSQQKSSEKNGQKNKLPKINQKFEKQSLNNVELTKFEQNQQNQRNQEKIEDFYDDDEEDSDTDWGSDEDKQYIEQIEKEKQNLTNNSKIQNFQNEKIPEEKVNKQKDEIITVKLQQTQQKTTKPEQFLPRQIQQKYNAKNRIIAGRPPYAKSNPYEFLTREEPTIIPQKPFKRAAEFELNEQIQKIKLLGGDFSDEMDSNDAQESSNLRSIDDQEEQLVNFVNEQISQKQANNEQIQKQKEVFQEQEIKLERKKLIDIGQVQNTNEQDNNIKDNNNNTESVSNINQNKLNKQQQQYISKQEFSDLLNQTIANQKQDVLDGDLSEENGLQVPDNNINNIVSSMGVQEKGVSPPPPQIATITPTSIPLQNNVIQNESDAVQNSKNYVQNGATKGQFSDFYKQQLVESFALQKNIVDRNGSRMLYSNGGETTGGSDDLIVGGCKRQTELQSLGDSGNIQQVFLDGKNVQNAAQQVAQLPEALKQIPTNVVSNLQQGVSLEEKQEFFANLKLDQNSTAVYKNCQKSLLKDLWNQMQVVKQQISIINSQMMALQTQMQTLEFSQQTLEEKIDALEESINQ